jgi:hypothetical protein
MSKLYALLMICVFGLAGCAETYYVHVNGFAEANNQISQNARIFVAANPESPNTLYDNEIKGKIVKLLSSRGFLPGDDPASEYILTFETGIMSHLVQDQQYVGSGLGYTSRRHVFINGGYYVPYIRTEWDQWLQIKVLRGDKAVWVGEASTSKYYTEKRRGIDYLLVGVFESFGQNTHNMKTFKITEKDPRIVDIKTYP